MTDKQIITKSQMIMRIAELSENLEAKEQECEELKKNVEHWKMEHKEAKAKGEWTYDLVKKRLEQQLDKLKADRKEALEQLEFIRILNTVQDTENRKLSKTLTEIKEIANKTLWTYSNLDDVTKYNMFDKILQIINEVEDDRC